jgi:hypothetical protein
MDILLMAHSVLRWLVLLAAAAAFIKFAMGWLRGGEFKGMDRGLTAAFSGLMDLQVTLGIAFLLWNGFAEGGTGFPMYRIEHGVAMILAAVVAHLAARWKNAGSKIRFRNTLFSIVASILLVIAGLAVLPGGLSR